MPALSAPSPFGIVTSTSKTRLDGSAEGATRGICPRNVRPGTASTETVCSAPGFMLPTTTSGTPNTTFTARRSRHTPSHAAFAMNAPPFSPASSSLG